MGGDWEWQRLRAGDGNGTRNTRRRETREKMSLTIESLCHLGVLRFSVLCIAAAAAVCGWLLLSSDSGSSLHGSVVAGHVGIVERNSQFEQGITAAFCSWPMPWNLVQADLPLAGHASEVVAPRP
eukprot:764962-Hanusia_phi.AAC.3